MSKTGCSEVLPPATSTGVSMCSDAGGGERTIRGPVHLDRRATTSASMSRSVKAMLGWDFRRCHASFVGIVSASVRVKDEMGREGVGMARGEWGCNAMFCDDGPTFGTLAGSHGQLSHGGRDEIFSQNALPNESSAQAGQLDGSPEQLAGVGVGWEGGETWNMVFICVVPLVRRRSGTGG